MNTTEASQIREQFLRKGFVVVPQFLDSNTLAGVNAEIHRHYALKLAETAASPEGFNADAKADNFRQFECEVIPWDPCGENNAVFSELRQMRRLQELTTACLGPGWTAPESLVMLSIGGGKGQAWHQDSPPDNSQAFNLNRLLYTEDINAADGAVVIVPGSHLQGRIPAGGNQEPMSGELVLEPRAGTLVLLHGHVYHRVTPNCTGKPRLSVNFRAFPQGISAEVCRVGIYRNGAYDFREGQVVNR